MIYKKPSLIEDKVMISVTNIYLVVENPALWAGSESFGSASKILLKSRFLYFCDIKDFGK